MLCVDTDQQQSGSHFSTELNVAKGSVSKFFVMRKSSTEYCSAVVVGQKMEKLEINILYLTNNACKVYHITSIKVSLYFLCYFFDAKTSFQ